MNKKTGLFSIRKIIFLVLIIFLLYIIGFAYINSHELIHRIIYDRHDMKAVSYMNLKLLSGKTIVIDDSKCNNFCKLENSLNDIAGYYLVVFIFNLWAMFFIFLAYKRFFEKWK